MRYSGSRAGFSEGQYVARTTTNAQPYRRTCWRLGPNAAVAARNEPGEAWKRPWINLSASPEIRKGDQQDWIRPSSTTVGAPGAYPRRPSLRVYWGPHRTQPHQ